LIVSLETKNIMKKIFSHFFKNIIRIFSGRNLLWHALAIVLTFIIVKTGFDWKFFVYVSGISWRMVFFPALMLGTILPLLVPLIFLLVSLISKNKKALKLGLAETEAVISGLFVSGLYKAFTGRVQPPGNFHAGDFDVSKLMDISHRFQFGFWRHGVFWGWPSSHTTLAFAMTVVIYVALPKNKIAHTIALVYVLSIGVGVAATGIHWFSEFIAGAIIGSIIGFVVSRKLTESGLDS
jgi:membrane-associated phospholipid phosphatase